MNKQKCEQLKRVIWSALDGKSEIINNHKPIFAPVIWLDSSNKKRSHLQNLKKFSDVCRSSLLSEVNANIFLDWKSIITFQKFLFEKLNISNWCGFWSRFNPSGDLEFIQNKMTCYWISYERLAGSLLLNLHKLQKNIEIKQRVLFRRFGKKRYADKLLSCADFDAEVGDSYGLHYQVNGGALIMVLPFYFRHRPFHLKFVLNKSCCQISFICWQLIFLEHAKVITQQLLLRLNELGDTNLYTYQNELHCPAILIFNSLVETGLFSDKQLFDLIRLL